MGVRLICLCRTDVKVLIAYSSIVHIGIMVVGILSGSFFGYVGAVLIMLAHGFSSPGLFSSANFNYEVVGSRHLSFSKGVGLLYPAGTLFWFVLLASNIAAPPSLSLVREILVCVRALKLGVWLFVFLGGATFLSAAYNLYLYSVQQGDVGLGVVAGRSMTSSFILSSFLHALPVYLCVLSVFMVVWADSLKKAPDCDSGDGILFSLPNALLVATFGPSDGRSWPFRDLSCFASRSF